MDELFPLFMLHAAALSFKLMIAQLFELILSALGLDIVKLRLGLVKVVFQEPALKRTYD